MFQSNKYIYMVYFAITAPADVLAPYSARTSAGTVMTTNCIQTSVIAVSEYQWFHVTLLDHISSFKTDNAMSHNFTAYLFIILLIFSQYYADMMIHIWYWPRFPGNILATAGQGGNTAWEQSPFRSQPRIMQSKPYPFLTVTNCLHCTEEMKNKISSPLKGKWFLTCNKLVSIVHIYSLLFASEAFQIKTNRYGPRPVCCWRIHFDIILGILGKWTWVWLK